MAALSVSRVSWCCSGSPLPTELRAEWTKDWLLSRALENQRFSSFGGAERVLLLRWACTLRRARIRGTGCFLGAREGCAGISWHKQSWIFSTKATWRSTGTPAARGWNRLPRRFREGSKWPPEQRCIFLGKKALQEEGAREIIYNRKHHLWTRPSTGQKEAQGAISSSEPFSAPFSSFSQASSGGGRGRNRESIHLFPLQTSCQERKEKLNLNQLQIFYLYFKLRLLLFYPHCRAVYEQRDHELTKFSSI